jgi:hypothetical protein
LPILALICLTLSVAVPAATECRTHRLEVPDPATLSLKEGENVIAAVLTEGGRLEARVTVKDKVVSEPLFFIGGKLLNETPESQIPGPVRDCLKNAQKAASTSGGFDSTTLHGLAWSAPAAFRAPKCVATATCAKNLAGGYNCIAYACCTVSSGGRLSTACVWYESFESKS